MTLLNKSLFNLVSLSSYKQANLNLRIWKLSIKFQIKQKKSFKNTNKKLLI